MIDIDQHTITQAVLAAQLASPSPRLARVMTSLVRHLHDFAREIELTEEEWFEGIRFLTRAGHITDDKRQEFILLSDVLGLSTLVTAQNNVKPPGCTEATVFGPFFVEGAPRVALGADIANGAKGTPCEVSGQVRSLDGQPVAGAVIDVWQSDEDGTYDVQRAPGNAPQARAQLLSDEDGRYRFRSILAHCYPIPHDGPVGDLLRGLGRHPWRPAHLHFKIEAPGYERLITHVFRDDDPYLESDAVFGVRSSLLAKWARRPEHGGASECYELLFDFVLNPLPKPATRDGQGGATTEAR
ncbi:Catechol 1,2-dioxygenase [plant metagenome]|uniref:Catechol 1,2-dioxygenase n=1 Tax=plant metagenome TaxID=1297885 RepID=A0A484SHT4_9ZZZZ